jgi:hypothetical protein
MVGQVYHFCYAGGDSAASQQHKRGGGEMPLISPNGEVGAEASFDCPDGVRQGSLTLGSDSPYKTAGDRSILLLLGAIPKELPK